MTKGLAAAPRYLLPYEAEGKSNRKIKVFTIGLASLLAVISILFVPHGISFFLPKYDDAILPIQIMSIAIIPLTISTIKSTEFLGKENSRVVLIGGVIQSGLYFLLLVTLGEAYGLFGLAVGFLVSAIARMIYNLIIGGHFNKKGRENNFE